MYFLNKIKCMKVYLDIFILFYRYNILISRRGKWVFNYVSVIEIFKYWLEFKVYRDLM